MLSNVEIVMQEVQLVGLLKRELKALGVEAEVRTRAGPDGPVTAIRVDGKTIRIDGLWRYAPENPVMWDSWARETARVCSKNQNIHRQTPPFGFAIRWGRLVEAHA